MRKRTLFFALASCLLGAFVAASALAADYEQTIEKFIGMLKAGQAEEAVDFLYGTNPWMSRKSDAVQNVRSRLGSINQMVGSLKNHEKLQELPLGTRFVYLSYLAAYERQPIRFEFEFYKPTDTWIIFSFSFDDKLDDDIEQQAKAKLIK
jgi:hypothetical protein